jgi:hypothetical protein
MQDLKCVNYLAAKHIQVGAIFSGSRHGSRSFVNIEVDTIPCGIQKLWLIAAPDERRRGVISGVCGAPQKSAIFTIHSA